MVSLKANINEFYPIELHYVKALFAEGQYRQCVQACRDIQKLVGDDMEEQPLRKAFINFYLALCHDEIARAMHHNSVAKLPGFKSAEQFYLDASDALPSADEARLLCKRLFAAAKQRDPFTDGNTGPSPVQSPGLFSRATSFMGSLASSPPLSPENNDHAKENLSFLSPAMSAQTYGSDFEELESHDSFSELMTPNRMPPPKFSRMSLLDRLNSPKQLPRDLSRMSLLEDTKAPKRLSRDISSMSLLEARPMRMQREDSARGPGLLRPIRPGSPTGRCAAPPAPSLPYSGTTAQLPSRLPKIATRSKTTPHLGAVSENGPFHHEEQERNSPVSPISRVDSPFHFSDASTISALSPQTPPKTSSHPRFGSLTLPPSESTIDPDTEALQEAKYLRILDHIQDLRLQLTTHIASVQTIIANLQNAQAERLASRFKPSTNKHFSSPIQASPKQKKVFGGGLPQAKSYWSFVPEDIKATEKKRRVEAGRARLWERKRFDPSKYRNLCERALAEL